MATATTSEQAEPPRMRFSQLKAMADSPMHYEHGMRHAKKRTFAMEKGTGVHSIISGQRKVVEYTLTKARAGKKWKAFEAAHADYDILTPAAYRTTMGMVEAVLKHERACELLMKHTRVEETIRFDYNGRPSRSTPDAATDYYAAELKSTHKTEPDKLMRHCRGMWYHAQLAFHLEALQAAGYALARDAYLIAVEATPPHPVTILRLSPRTLDLGARAVRLWFERLLQCEAAKQWPPYVQHEVEWDIDDDPELIFGDEDPHDEVEAA